jgi:hypothetical protein
MARSRPGRIVPGEHLVTTFDGDVLHSNQVTMGLYGSQKGRVVAIDELDGPDVAEMQRRSRERLRPLRPLKLPITGPEREN